MNTVYVRGGVEGHARKCEQARGYCRVTRQQAFSVSTKLRGVAVAKSGHTAGLRWVNGRTALTAEGPHSRYQARPSDASYTHGIGGAP